MLNTRYFTKSLFKLALECPTKLYYFGKPEYKNDQEEDAFLEALKDGGYQVGALAKAYIGGGVDLEACDNEQAYQQTQELLRRENVIIYEPLFRHENMQVRSDILIKNGNNLEIIEVKMKSYREEEDSKFRDANGQIINEFRNKNGSLISEWKEYLLDVAFQSYVINKAIPSSLKANCFLMLIDKDQTCPVDGLNQKFLIQKDTTNKKVKIIVKELTFDDTSRWLLKKINIDQQINELKQEEYKIDTVGMSFDLYINRLADGYTNDKKIQTPLGGKKCKDCEFISSFQEENEGIKSGFRECWKQVLKWQDRDFRDKSVLDIWKLNSNKLIEDKKIKINDLSDTDIHLKEESDSLTQSSRQWLQVKKYQLDDNVAFIHPNLKEVISKWIFPFHFIDFETCTTPIPFHQAYRPYEPLAFQYSHHIMHEDGSIEHKGEYIETRVGVFPNYDFVRSLKRELEHDIGTIFRFHNHENTILNAIYEQLKDDPAEVTNRAELMDFILSITVKKTKDSKKIIRRGPRCMVDLEEILRKYTYFPSTNGRTSMKVTFPEILKLSKSLQGKYSQPIYGAKNGIKSLNFENWSVVKKDNSGEILDPYSRLPGVFENVPPEDVDLFEKAERIREIKEVREGGMASTAYAMMQFTEMHEVERKALQTSLLKYCEVDTLAMVILYEYLHEKTM